MQLTCFENIYDMMDTSLEQRETLDIADRMTRVIWILIASFMWSIYLFLTSVLVIELCHG